MYKRNGGKFSQHTCRVLSFRDYTDPVNNENSGSTKYFNIIITFFSKVNPMYINETGGRGDTLNIECHLLEIIPIQ